MQPLFICLQIQERYYLIFIHWSLSLSPSSKMTILVWVLSFGKYGILSTIIQGSILILFRKRCKINTFTISTISRIYCVLLVALIAAHSWFNYRIWKRVFILNYMNLFGLVYSPWFHFLRLICFLRYIFAINLYLIISHSNLLKNIEVLSHFILNGLVVIEVELILFFLSINVIIFNIHIQILPRYKYT